jgi:hypothetical protein
MTKLEQVLSGWNFRKIAAGCLIALLIAAIGASAAAAIVFRDRISFAWQYSRASETAEKDDRSDLQNEIDRLASSSPDVADILILDSGNHVVYSAKKSQFGNGILTLAKGGEGNSYLVCDRFADVVFKYVRSRDFMFASVFNQDFGSIREEYENGSFYESGFSGKTIYLLSYIGEKSGGMKIYVISSPTSVPGGTLTLKICACIAMLFFMIFWVLLALWTYQDAAKAKLCPLCWGIIVLLTNIVGVIVYQIYKRGSAVCPACGASQNRMNRYCFNCGEKLAESCPQCGGPISKKDRFCPRCGKQIKS